MLWVTFWLNVILGLALYDVRISILLSEQLCIRQCATMRIAKQPLIGVSLQLIPWPSLTDFVLKMHFITFSFTYDHTINWREREKALHI